MYAMEREVNQIIWSHYIRGNIGYYEKFENDIFIIKPYDWSDNDDNAWHFYHKPSGLKVRWYTYPLCAPYSNIKITHEQWRDVLVDCYNSTSNLIKYGYDAWWEYGEHISPNGAIDDKLIKATLSEYAPIEVLADYVLDGGRK